jgi:hypothetical protein
MAVSLIAHLLLIWAVISIRPPPAPAELADPPVTVELVDADSIIPKPAPPAPAKKSPARLKPKVVAKVKKPTPARIVARKTPVRAHVETLAADTDPGLTEAQLAGAAVAGSGEGGNGAGGGGRCDMAARVQAALRRDDLVRSEVARTAGKALLVWNGDWVRSSGQDGKGLAAVREAILWEVGFAPAACRSQPVRGLVLVSINVAGGTARLALGTGSWRWSDVLHPHAEIGADR